MRIGDLARVTGIKAETIRFFEKEGLLPTPARTGGNYRQYEPAHAIRLSFIKRARELGFTLLEVRQFLSLADDSSDQSHLQAELIDAHLEQVDERINDLTSLRARLVRMKERKAPTSEDLLSAFVLPQSESDVR